MPNVLENLVLEPHLRSVSSATLYINSDDSWSIGPDVQHLVKVSFGSYASINDTTFDFSAIDVEKGANGGYRLFVQSDADPNVVVQADVDAKGVVTGVAALTPEQMYAYETQYSVDLNGNGGFGSSPAAIQGGAMNLYISATGVYQLGTSPDSAQSITLSGTPLTVRLLPAGWEIVNAEPSSAGYSVYVRDSAGATFLANLNARAEYLGGGYMTSSQIAATESSTGVDVNGDLNVPANAGWTSVLKTASIRSAVESAIAATGKMNYSQVVSLATGIIQSHVASGNSPFSATEIADLQAISSRGKNLFSVSSLDGSASDYLANVFSKMVDGSVANEFYTGGQATRTPLGNLVPNSPLATFQRLVDKWLLGGDNPTPSAGGDAATGKAATTVGVYAKSQGTLIVDGISPADIKQGQVGDCFLAAALISIADSQPALFKSMMVDNGTLNGTHTWGVRFFDSNGRANWVTVNDLLPVTDAGSAGLIYGGNPTGNLNGEIWFPLIEKAYAEANTLKILPRGDQTGQNSYWGIEGGFGDPIANITGKKVTYYSLQPTSSSNPYLDVQVVDAAAAQAAILGAVASSKPVWIGSFVKTADAYGNTLLTSGHAFSLVNGDKGAATVTSASIYNPWGISQLPTPPQPTPAGYLSPFAEPSGSLLTLIGNPELLFMVG